MPSQAPRSIKHHLLVAVSVCVLLIVGVGASLFAGKVAEEQSVAQDTVDTALAPDARPVLRAYPSTAGPAQAMATFLEQQLAGRADIRIIADQARSQVLVIAPPDVHAQIAQRVAPAVATPNQGMPDQGTRAPMPTGPTPASPPSGGAVTRQEIKLWQSTGPEIEAALVRTLGQRLAPVTAPHRAMSAYQLHLSSGHRLGLLVDRQGNRIQLEGLPVAVESATQLIHALDHPQPTFDGRIGLVSLERAQMSDVEPVVAALQASQGAAAPAAPPPADQPPAAAPPVTEPGAPPGETTQIVPIPGTPGAAAAPGQAEGLIGPVQIQILEGLDVLVIRGNERDVRRVREIIEQIEQLSAQTKPAIQVVPLAHVESVALAALLQQVYSEIFAARLGTLSITALGKPNALLLIGREETIQAALDLIRRLDKPVPPATQFQVFRLKTLPAEEAVENIEAFFEEQDEAGSLAPRIQVIADFRSNSVIVRASPRELAEVGSLLARLDTGESAAVNEVRVFKLKNSVADELAPVLQDAITGQIYGPQASRGGQFGAVGGAGQREDYERKSSRLQFVTIDPRGHQVLKSGILTDAQITADARTNSVVATASAESMPLIAALIQELDQPSVIEAQVKVFTLVNSDATSMSQMLQNIFGTTTGAQGVSVRTGTALDESALVGLRFAVDARTNSIIVTGSTGALTVVEAILLRLDESDVRNRKTAVYRLKNAPATDVATAVNEYLTSERQVEQIAPDLISAFEQIEREVVVVAEPVSNSLIIAATQRYFEEILKLVEELDARPPMVMIQVLIAEVALRDTDEFGVELGLQDSILFDRSVITGTGGASVLTPGYLFNNAPLGNSASAQSLASSNKVGGQSITSLGVGRSNSELGFGGLVLSASSESVSVLIRALQQTRRLEVLSRPQVMTMDNQLAQVFVGQDVPTITASQLTQFGTQNSVVYRETGLILTVTPRISPDKLVVMEIQAEKSAVGPDSEGIPIAVSEGEVIRSPRIDRITARTVISALDGQTVVLGGLITTRNELTKRRVPYLADIPLLGHLFQYKYDNKERAELLIIMTPRIVESTEDADKIKRIESARMHWCLSDVVALHDGDGLGNNGATWYDGNSAVIYPDLDPTLRSMQELTPPGDARVSPKNQLVPTPDMLPSQAPSFVPEDAAGPTLAPEPVPAPDPAGTVLPPSVPPGSGPQTQYNRPVAPMPAQPDGPWFQQPESTSLYGQMPGPDGGVLPASAAEAEVASPWQPPAAQPPVYYAPYPTGPAGPMPPPMMQ